MNFLEMSRNDVKLDDIILLLFLGAPEYEYLPIPFNQVSCVAVPTLEMVLALI
jgi:hypothetical protein